MRGILLLDRARRRVDALCQLGVATLLLAVLAGAVRADDTLHADCDATEHFRVLAPSQLPADAQAIWLDAQRLRWPQAPAAGQIVLLHSDTPIKLGPQSPPEKSVRRIELSSRSNVVPFEQFRRFLWFGGGAEFVLPEDIDAADLLRGDLRIASFDAEGHMQAHTRVQHAAALDARFTAALDVPLGAVPTDASVRFALWAPTAHQVAACIHADDNGEAQSAHLLDRDAASGVWSASLPQARIGSYYTYLVDVFVPGHGLLRNRVTDPYALGLGADGRRAMVVDLDDARFKPAGWDTQARPPAPEANVDMVLYELHVRDFSRDDDSVAAEHRGRYRGFSDPATRGMRHLRALAEAGLSDVHLLPVYDIASIPETGCAEPQIGGAPDSPAQQAAIADIKHRDCFNWGYDPQHYSVPEGSYASDASDGAVRIRELRQLVMSLHSLGLRVGLDVVYNHTSHAGQHPQSVLDRIVPGYYHRLNAQGAIERSTCCENTATEHAMMARLMIDSAVVWARDYRIDGFRFDLMGHQPKAAMLRLSQAVDAAAGKRIPIIGEGWNFGEVVDGARFEQASQLSLAGSGIATFSDRARDAIRGGGAATKGAELRTALGWVHGRDLALGIGDSETRESAALSPLSPRGRGAGGEGAHRESPPPLPNPPSLRSGSGERRLPQAADTRSPSLPTRGEGLESATSVAFASSANSSQTKPESRIPNPGSTADLIHVGLAGSLRDYLLTGSDGVTRSLAEFDYAGQPAGYVASPNEVVNYVENHDNQTLFDINALRLPQDTSASERARVQLLAVALNMFSQGVPYFHAGVEVLRSKSLDRNSYDSGDHFNRLDYSGADNGFGRGLPPAWDNRDDWPQLRPLLADASIKPDAANVDWTRRAFLDLLRLRASTALLRLRSSEQIGRRLSVLNTGPAAVPGVVAAHIDGDGLQGAGFAALIYAVNADTRAQRIEVPQARGLPFVLHPLHAAETAADRRPQTAQFDRERGELRIPPRTAVVWVLP
jgi:pullulanase/glycogen debranching enzyme